MNIAKIPLEEILGMIGGGLFFASWLLQAWETKQAGKAIVSFNFILLRLISPRHCCFLRRFESSLSQ